MAKAFVTWFDVSKKGRWLDVGCGTGALTAAVLNAADPIAVKGVDPSADFLNSAKDQIFDTRAHFEVGDACALQASSGEFEAVVAGLVLNHLPDPSLAVREMVRTARSGGAVGAYVWDYDGEMQLIRLFWDAVAAIDPEAKATDPRPHYPICKPDPLRSMFREAGLIEVNAEAIDLPMAFRDFDDYWRPHMMKGPGVSQRYVSALQDEHRDLLREQLLHMLPISADGTINLTGRAWAVRGTKVIH
jgi:SAM-dependent methyltransferase